MRHFFLRTPPRHEKDGGFPAVCVATNVQEVMEGSERFHIEYAISSYNLDDQRAHFDQRLQCIVPPLPYKRDTAVKRARGRLSSPNHRRTITVPTEDVPHQVKRRICEDIVATSKSEQARLYAQHWLNQAKAQEVAAAAVIDKDFIEPRPAEPPFNSIRDGETVCVHGYRPLECRICDLGQREEPAIVITPTNTERAVGSFMDRMFGPEPTE